MNQTGYLFDPEEVKTAGCFRCPLRDTTIVENVVVKSPLMFIGEAPGDVELIRGEPFCGPAGQEFNRHLKICRIPRSKVSVGNIIRCASKTGDKNREPTKTEMQCCSLYLREFIETGSPRVIVALGNTATKALLGPQRVGISKLRGRVFWYQDKPIYVIPTFHPSYFLRDNGAFTGRQAIKAFQRDLLKARTLCMEPFEDHRTSVLVANHEKQALLALKAVAKQKQTAVDVEGFRPNNLLTVSFSSDSGTGAVVIPVLHSESKLTKNGKLPTSIYSQIRKILTSSRIEIIGQNFNDLDRTLLEKYFNCVIKGVRRDTMYGSYVDDSRSRVHSLGLIAARYANMGNYDWNLEQWAGRNGMSRGEAMGNCGQMPLSLLGMHNGLDVIATHLSCDAMWENFSNSFKRLTKVLTEASRATQEMEDTGIMFDMSHSLRLSKTYESTLKDLTNQIKGLIGDRTFNPASPEQVSDYVFETLEMHEGVDFSAREKKLLKTPTGKWSTKEEILTKICNETAEGSIGKEFLETLLTFRDQSKDKGTFIDGYQERVNSDKRIHVPIILHGSETGRATCTLHNVKKTLVEDENGEKHYILLDQFIASPGYKLVRGDYKQVELRMAAEISQDEAFLQTFQTGRDPHYETAKFIFQLLEGIRETSRQRTIAKNANFGSLFGLAEDELYDYLTSKIADYAVSREDTANFHRSFYQKHKRFREWQLETIEFAKQYGFVKGLFGRRRRLNPDQGRHFENQAVNSPIQGSAHDLLLLAMIQLFHLRDRDFRILLDHHDALWLEVPEDTLYPNLARIKKAMENVDTEKWYRKKLSVPTPIDLEVGERMGSMKEVTLDL